MRKLSAVRSQLTTQAAGRRGVDAQGASIPPPIEGWDAISPIAQMSPKRAVRMDNWFPQASWVELRKGYRTHCDTGSGLPVQTLAAYQGASSRKLFAWTGSEIWDVTAAGLPTLDVSGVGDPRAQYVNFATTGGNFLWTCNGADDPYYYDGSTWAQAVITGISGSDINNVCSFKNRLFFALNDSSDLAYLPVDSIQGAANTLPLGGYWSMGGRLQAIGTWSVDGGNGPNDYLVCISSRGQVAIFQGDDPDDAPTNWSLVNVFSMGAPIGDRCLMKVGGDLGVICIDGVVPLSKSMIFDRAAVAQVSLTQNIQRVMNQSARDYLNNFGWQLIGYPRGTRAILNVPVSENDIQVQYVMNTLTGAWCRFLGMNANCWELLSDDLFFGGNNGIVYEADVGGSDEDAVLSADMMTSYNYYGVRGKLKRWTEMRTLLTTDGTVNPGIALNVDFATDAPINTPTTTISALSLWDVALWDVGLWAGEFVTQNWNALNGLGYCASIRLAVDVDGASDASIVLQVNGFDVQYQPGAFI